MARRRSRRRACAGDSTGDRRPGARDREGAGADRHRARSDTSRNRPHLETYLDRQLRPTVIRTARQMFTRHRTVLDEIGERYGVSPRLIVSIWGLESNFGKFTGVRPTIGALATLAWDPRRSTFFRGELLSAMEILDRGDIDVSADARLVGRRDGPAAVHAVELFEVGGGFRRRRPPRHLVDAVRRVRVDRELPAGARLEDRTDLGTRGDGLARGRPADRQRRCPARRIRASRGAT